jgi:hypothetical protein
VIGRPTGGPGAREPLPPPPAPAAAAAREPAGRGPAVAAAAPAGDAPAPQGRILGGSANVRLTLGRQGDAVVITPVIAAKGVAVGAGDVKKDVGNFNVNTAVRLVPKASAQPEDATFLQRLSELTIPSLALTGSGADVRLEQPLVVRDPGVALASFGGDARPRPAQCGGRRCPARRSARSSAAGSIWPSCSRRSRRGRAHGPGRCTPTPAT